MAGGRQSSKPRSPGPTCPHKQDMTALPPTQVGGLRKKTAQLWVGQGPPACLLLSALPMWEALVPSQCGSGELTALKGFLNLCSSKPAARRSFGVWSTRSLNLDGRRPEVYLMVTGNTGCCCDRQLPSPLQPHRSAVRCFYSVPHSHAGWLAAFPADSGILPRYDKSLSKLPIPVVPVTSSLHLLWSCPALSLLSPLKRMNCSRTPRAKPQMV